MTETADSSPPVATKLREAIADSRFRSVRGFAPAFAEAKGIDQKSALRSLRKYTATEKPTTPSESTALILANLLEKPQGYFVSPSAAQRADRDARAIATLEARVTSLESEVRLARDQLGELLDLLRGNQPGEQDGRGGGV